jgi:hypothetical protein
MTEEPQEKKAPWYFKTSTIVIALLSVGPLALPLVWARPRWSRATKTIVTVVVLVVTYLLWDATSRALKSLGEYMQMLS